MSVESKAQPVSRDLKEIAANLAYRVQPVLPVSQELPGQLDPLALLVLKAILDPPDQPGKPVPQDRPVLPGQREIKATRVRRVIPLL